ncbi:MAG: PEP-CTERM sorting domain-containing protein [Planctomycetota bacterium]|jgi:hypothetical protein
MYRLGTLLGSLALTATVAAAGTTTVTFDSGSEGWDGPQGPGGHSFVDGSFGNTAPALRTQFNDFGISFRNETNPAFLGDYTQHGSVDFSIDVYTSTLNFLGLPTPRPFVLELINYDLAPDGYPWISVWVELSWLDESNPGWHTLTASIADPTSATLPDGWFTNLDVTNFELPEGVTFADIISGVDRIHFTTFEPGWFFSSSDYDVSVDNITITTGGGTDPCAADVDGSGAVDVDDLVEVVLSWGACMGCPADVDNDGIVGVDDLVEVILRWGPCE